MGMSLDSEFQRLQTARPRDRKAILDELLSGDTNPLELHRRAVLMTRLRIERLWPLKVGDARSAFDEEDDGA